MTETSAFAATPDIPPPPSEPAPPPPQRLPLEFTGRTGEYFRIWIVNLFLSIITIGIYSAWAKVRRRRYFYGHTWLDGSNFEYHGDPKVILRGRLIAVLLFASYSLLTNYSPRLAAAAALAALPLAPWMLVRSFRFNAVNTSYRNVRFGFEGRYGQVLVSILPLVIFPLVTLVFGRYDPNGSRQPTAAEWASMFLPAMFFLLSYPWMSGRLHLLRVNGSRFGTTAFSCASTIAQFYGIYVLAVLLGLCVAVLVFIPVGLLMAIGTVLPKQAYVAVFACAIGLGYVAILTFGLSYTQSRIANRIYNATTLGPDVRLHNALKARRLARVYFVNLFAILFTLGLAIPWASIRLARVRAAALEVEAAHGFDAFVAGVTPAVGATGEEIGEFFAFDVAL